MFYHGLKYYIAITRSFKSIFVSISINKSFTMLIFDDSIMDGDTPPPPHIINKTWPQILISWHQFKTWPQNLISWHQFKTWPQKLIKWHQFKTWPKN